MKLITQRPTGGDRSGPIQRTGGESTSSARNLNGLRDGLRDVPDRVCDVPDCGNLHRAKGLCSTHYNRQMGSSRYKVGEIPCGYCGDVMLRPKRSDRAAQFCSFLCRDLWNLEHEGFRTSCVVPSDHPARWFGATCRVEYSACHVCDASMAWDARQVSPQKYCSEKCRRRGKAVALSVERRKAKEVARKRRRQIRREIRRRALFERDDWQCWLCGGRTSVEYSHNDPLSPTIDHMQPVSLGGDDDPTNLATAHLICNSLRRNTYELTWPAVA